MKKLIPFAILFVFALFIWNASVHPGMNVQWDGDDFDGPLGFLVGGAAMLLAGTIIVFVTVLLGIVFAGIGVALLGGLALALVLLSLALSPLMLPLLIPFGIYWFMQRRKQRAAGTAASAPAAPAAPALGNA